MSDTDTLIFPNPTGFVPGPTIDGFFDLDYMITGETPETGYVGGSQLTIGASGIPPVVFRGVRHTGTNRIAMGFMCRFSGSFAADNAVAVAVKPLHASPHADARKIIVKPVQAGVGAEPGVGTGTNEIKTNITPPAAQFDCYDPDGTGWMDAAGTWPNDVEVKVRSWRPSVAPGSPDEFAWSVEISLPIAAAAAAGWPGLTNHFGLSFSVIKIVPVGGGAVSQFKFPAAMNDITGSVALWTPSVYGHGLVPGIAGPALPNIAQGVRFTNDWQGIGRRAQGSGSLALGSQIQGPGGTEDNEIVALLENTGTSPANDVTCEIRFANWGLPPATFPAWDRPPGLVPNPAPRRTGPTPDPAVNVNAGASNVPIVMEWPRASVTGPYATHPHQCMWAQLDANSPVNFIQSSTRRNMDFVSLSEISEEAEVSGKGYEEPADGSGQHDFVIETFCRRIVVRELIGQGDELDPELIEILRPALLGDREGGRDRPVAVTHVDTMRRAMSSTTSGQQFQDTVVFVWQSFGYRVTDHTITIGKTTYPLLDNGTGSFGYVARHEGIDDAFGWTFSGPDMVRYGSGLYGLKVPHKGVTRIKVRVYADRGAPKGDSRTDLPKGEFTPPKPRDEPGPGSDGGPKPGDGGDKNGGCFSLVAGMVLVPAAAWGLSQLIA